MFLCWQNFEYLLFLSKKTNTRIISVLSGWEQIRGIRSGEYFVVVNIKGKGNACCFIKMNSVAMMLRKLSKQF